MEPCWNLVGTFKIAHCRMEVRLLTPTLSSVEEEREAQIADCRMEVRLLTPALSSVEEEREKRSGKDLRFDLGLWTGFRYTGATGVTFRSGGREIRLTGYTIVSF